MCVNCYISNIIDQLNNIDDSIEEYAPLTNDQLSRLEDVENRIKEYLND